MAFHLKVVIDKIAGLLSSLARGIKPKLPPPGKVVPLSQTEYIDRNALLKLTQVHGPIFSASDSEGPMVCLVGLSLGRRFLKKHAANLRPVTLDVTALFPMGFMRQMEGATHKRYRKALTDAMRAFDIDNITDELETISTRLLQVFAQETDGANHTSHAYLVTLTDIATGFLIRVFFGLKPNNECFDTFKQLFQRLGPHGLVWNIKDAQTSAFNELRTELLGLAKGISSNDKVIAQNSIFYSMVQNGTLDDTSLGNLIYMVEMGRYDMKGLFRWISKYAADNPNWLARIAEAEESSNAEESSALTLAFVKETLRMDQSERLMRNVKNDIVFEGYLIPKGWRARVCLWEAHKDASTFVLPFKFDPARFLSKRFTTDEYSPFGMDHHQCPFSKIAMTLGGTFLRTLARDYRVTEVNSGKSVRGGYHWEPAPKFSVALSKRQGTSSVEGHVNE